MSGRLLEVRDLCVTVPVAAGGREAAVEGVSVGVDVGETLVIVGESGSGKTLTALSVLGLLPAAAEATGRVEFDGRDLLAMGQRELRHVRGRDIAMIYQDPLSALNPVWTIGEQIAETIRLHHRVGRAEAARKAVDLLGRVGLPSPQRVAVSYPHELSGGMRQRALIAIALSCGPRLIIADEPTTALDVTVQAQILELLHELTSALDLAVVLITHDMGIVADIADRVMVMYGGKVVEIGDVHDVFERPAHPYTAALLRSVAGGHVLAKAPLPTIPGVPPPLTSRPPGCAFHPRCEQAADVCAVDPPQLRTVGRGRVACHFPLATHVEGQVSSHG